MSNEGGGRTYKGNELKRVEENEDNENENESDGLRIRVNNRRIDDSS